MLFRSKSVGCAAEEVDRQQRDMVDKLRGRGRWEGDPHPTWERGQGRSPEPFLHYLSVAPTYPMLGPNKRAAQKMAGGLVSEGGIITSQTDQTWWYLGGIRRDWKSAERPERVGVGEGVDGISIDEAARVKPALWDDHAQPALADHGGWALIRSTPMGKASWFYRVWALGDPEAANDIAESTGEDIAVDPHARCFHWTTMDNTAVPRLIEWAERMKRRMPLAMWRRNFAASWAAFVGQCLEIGRAHV